LRVLPEHRLVGGRRWRDQWWRGHVSINTSGGNPTMDYNEHNRTYSGFVKATKYMVGIAVLTLILMAIFLT
jgi:hypothetical protein